MRNNDKSRIHRFKKRNKNDIKTIKIISEGDSWFHLPGRNIIHWLKKDKFLNILRLEQSGDEVVEILSGHQKKKLRNLLKEHEFDYILFSGGGNDIIGDGFYEIINNHNDSEERIEEKAINWEVFNRRKQMIQLVYEELIFLRDEYKPDMKIITHCYDYVIPSNNPIKLLFFFKIGPWILPDLLEKGWNNKEDQKKIIKILCSIYINFLK